eukprot:m.356755 g.356755  ORF g.356755 m.356755 type:complete len:885 (-) comp17622_c0_seq1:169-2823(-)
MGAEGFGSESFDAQGERVSSGGISGGSGPTRVFGAKKSQDPATLLDVGTDKERLKVMKTIIQRMSAGEDQSEFFPQAVKCVACQSIELRKLVYLYLVRYSDQFPEVALLSISTFQKGLSDPNQLIRASSLRILSSIRIPDIVQIMEIALKQAANDMSPYVRKATAHALPKLFNLAPTEIESVMEILEKLLADRTTMVIGSAILAFEEICPDRLDLLHVHFKKLCNMLIDLDEWGQIAVIHLLVRYCRTQFVDPNLYEEEGDAEANFYGAESEESDTTESDGEGEEGEGKAKKPYMMDPDFRLFLRSMTPLLHSRNAGVVLAVTQAYHHLAPNAEVKLVVAPLVALLSRQRETQFAVLTTIASMVQTRTDVFAKFLREFFVRYNDPLFVKLLKLEILTVLANEANISSILREFQEYVKYPEKKFVTQTIQCIGRCASALSNVTESCLTGLMGLMSHGDEIVVAESVVIIKKLLQLDPGSHTDIIKMMSRLAITIQVPMARASILWIIGEYSEHVPQIAPDVLRQMAKTFAQEENIVKLQIINLAAKLYLTNSKQTKLLCNYVLSLAKYDQNYDIRDRARMVRVVLFTKETRLRKKAKRFFLSEKPAPNFKSTFDDRSRYEVGSMSFLLNQECTGWIPLAEFPEDAPDPTVRQAPEPPTPVSNVPSGLLVSSTDSYSTDSDSDSSSGSSSSGSGSSSSGSSSSGSGSSTDSDSDSDASTNSFDASSTDDEAEKAPAAKVSTVAAELSSGTDSDAINSATSDSEDTGESEEEDEGEQAEGEGEGGEGDSEPKVEEGDASAQDAAAAEIEAQVPQADDEGGDAGEEEEAAVPAVAESPSADVDQKEEGPEIDGNGEAETEVGEEKEAEAQAEDKSSEEGEGEASATDA